MSFETTEMQQLLRKKILIALLLSFSLSINGIANGADLSSKNQALSASPQASLALPCKQVTDAFIKALGTNDPKLSAKIQSYLNAFCKKTQIPTENKIITLNIIEELIKHDKSALGLSKIQRASLALDTLSNIASPTGSIQQVGSTCKFAAYEVRVATLNPELYASLIMQVALSGQFKCTDGSIIIYPPNSVSNVETAKYANWASRIFQITACNIGWQTSTMRPDKLAAEKGCLRFEIAGKVEGLKDYSLDKNFGLNVYSRSGRVKTPYTSREQEKLINKLLTGREEITVINEQYKDLNDPGAFTYDDFAQLQKFLQYTAEGRLPNVRFPLMISVDGDRLINGTNAPTIFRNREGTHLATLMSYDPKTQKVELNNTWGDEDDFLGERALTLSQLWEYLPRPKK